MVYPQWAVEDASPYGIQPAFSKNALPPPMGEVAEHSEAGEGTGTLSRLRRQRTQRESDRLRRYDFVPKSPGRRIRPLRCFRWIS